MFWENDAPWAGVRVVDVYPSNVTVADNQFVDNFALTCAAFNVGLYGNMFPAGYGVLGSSYHWYLRNELTAPTANPEFKFELGPIIDYIYRAHLFPPFPSSLCLPASSADDMYA